MKTIKEIFKDSFVSFYDEAFVLALKENGFTEDEADQIDEEMLGEYEDFCGRFGCLAGQYFDSCLDYICGELEKKYSREVYH